MAEMTIKKKDRALAEARLEIRKQDRIISSSSQLMVEQEAQITQLKASNQTQRVFISQQDDTIHRLRQLLIEKDESISQLQLEEVLKQRDITVHSDQDLTDDKTQIQPCELIKSNVHA